MEVRNNCDDFTSFNTELFGNKAEIKKLLKLRTKKRLITADIRFLNRCLRYNITPKFVRKIVKYNHNSKAQIAAEKKVIEVEINEHYKRLNNLDLMVYDLHLKLSKELGHVIWQNLEEKFFELLNHKMDAKKDILRKKFNSLLQTQIPVGGEKLETEKEDPEKTNIVNLSKKSFTHEELKVLDLGLNTCVDYSHKIEDYIADVEVAIFGKTEEEKNLIRVKSEEIIREIAEKEKKHPYNPYRKIIKNLNDKGVLYTKADKGNKLVIMDKEDYDKNMETVISGGEFIEIKSDPTKQYTNTYVKTIKNIKKVLNDREKTTLKPDNPIAPRIYGLPKIHRPGNKMRPIVDNINAPTYKLAKWLTSKFQTFPKFETKSIKNSLELVNHIKNLELDENDRLVSFDVSSMFPCIPIEKTLGLLKSWLATTDLDEESINEYVKLTELCVQQNYCSFKNKYYKQERGLAMGNPLSPFLADLFMSNLEIQVTKAFPQMFKIWYRYVDDIFAIVNKKRGEDAEKLLNLQDRSIKFTTEWEKDGILPFLDLKVIRNIDKLEFGIFRKETQTDNYIKAYSYNPRPHKHAIINSLTFRLTNIPLNKKEYNKEYEHILHTANKNGFGKELVEKKIKKFKHQKLKKEISTLNNLNEERKFKKFTFHPYVHHKFQKIFNEININLAPVNNYKLKSVLKSEIKDKVPTSQKSGIYKIACKNCNKSYIGKTKRNLNTRVNEHFRNIRFKQVDKSAVAHHVWIEDHEMEREAKLLKEGQKPAELTIWEKVYIQKYKNQIVNFEIPKEKDLISRCIQPIGAPSTGPVNNRQSK